MERSNSFGTSWADQWDNDSYPTSGNKSSSNTKKSGGIEKTKAVASTGLKKVKDGTTTGFQWMKHKYQQHSKKTKKN